MPNTLNPGIDELINPVNGVIDEFTQVRVVNGSQTPIRWQYAGRWFEIPGQNDPQGRRPHTVMPYHAMVLYCGDPRSFDVPGDMRQRERTNELKRLCTLYGIYDNIDNKSQSTHFPMVQVFTLNDTRIVTVLDDPSGDTTSEEAANLSAVEQLQRLVAAQGEALRNYQAQLDQIQRETRGTWDEADNPHAMEADMFRDDTGNPQYVPDAVEPEQTDVPSPEELAAQAAAQELIREQANESKTPDEVVNGEIEAAFLAGQTTTRKPGEIPGTTPDQVASSLPPAPQAPAASPFGR